MRVSIVKVIAGAALVIASVVAASEIATAERPAVDYPPSPCAVTTNTTLAPGGTIPITSTDGTPNGTTTFRITQPDGSVVELTGQNNADGSATVYFLSPNQSGTYSILAICPDLSSSPPTIVVGVSKLPVTGSDPLESLRLAGVLVVLGGGIFVVARKRRHEPVAA